MSVRAKFTHTGYESSVQSTYPYQKEDGSTDYSKPKAVELRTLKFSPVYGNGDPNHENTKFWAASPSGSIMLGTINPDAWQHFEIGKEYYVTFDQAPNN